MNIPFVYLILIAISLLNLSLGLIVLFNNRKNQVNIVFFAMTVLLALWAFTILMNWVVVEGVYVDFWSNATFWGPSFLSGFLLYFSLIFTRNHKKRGAKTLSIILFPALILFILALFNQINNKTYNPWTIERGFGIHIFNIYFSICAIFCFINLYRSIRRAVNIEKTQIKFVFFGFSMALLIGVFFNLLLPLVFDYTKLTYIGPSAAGTMFIVFTAYAITRHHLFNVKVIATEILTSAILLTLLTRVLFSNTLQDLFFNIVIFLAVLIFGLLLIRSVIKEIGYREEIKKAYDVEKLAHQELERLDEVKDQFLMATQHHLRTPITSMIGYTDMLLDGFYGDVSPKTKETLLKLMKSSKNLNKVVNELLDLSQFQLGKSAMVLKPGVEIMPILKSIIAEVKLEAKEKKLYLRMEKPEEEIPEIKADASKLEVALTNLIDNAVKYTAKGGVKIKVERPDSKIRIIIKDTGMGMAKEDIEKLFSKTFERGEEAKKMFGSGKGIGLYLSYNIIKSHNGKLWAESDGPGKGSSFIVELPV